MKKIIASVMCFVLALLLFACGSPKAQSIGTPAVPEDAVTMQGKVIFFKSYIIMDWGRMVIKYE